MDGDICGLYYRDNGKENGKYHNGLFGKSLYYKKGTVLGIFIIEEVRCHEGRGFLLDGPR